MEAERQKKESPVISTDKATRRRVLAGAAGVFGCLMLGSAEARAGGADEISSACEVIHQEVGFKVSRKRVYEALTDASNSAKW